MAVEEVVEEVVVAEEALEAISEEVLEETSEEDLEEEEVIVDEDLGEEEAEEASVDDQDSIQFHHLQDIKIKQFVSLFFIMTVITMDLNHFDSFCVHLKACIPVMALPIMRECMSLVPS